MTRFHASLLGLGLAIVCVPVSAPAQEQIELETLTLKAGEKMDYAFEASSRTKVGIDLLLSYEETKKCKNECVQLAQEGGLTMASSMGPEAGLMPQGGKIAFTVTNVEDFPIEVKVWRE